METGSPAPEAYNATNYAVSAYREELMKIGTQLQALIEQRQKLTAAPDMIAQLNQLNTQITSLQNRITAINQTLQRINAISDPRVRNIYCHLLTQPLNTWNLAVHVPGGVAGAEYCLSSTGDLFAQRHDDPTNRNRVTTLRVYQNNSWKDYLPQAGQPL